MNWRSINTVHLKGRFIQMLKMLFYKISVVKKSGKEEEGHLLVHIHPKLIKRILNIRILLIEEYFCVGKTTHLVQSVVRLEN